MCEADLSSADQVVIFKGDFACLQAINLTDVTTGDLVFMGGTKFLPVKLSPRQLVVREVWKKSTLFILFLFLKASLREVLNTDHKSPIKIILIKASMWDRMSVSHNQV